MLIGEDFDKIEFEWMGFRLLEPNVIISDLLVFITAIYFTYKVKNLNHNNHFFKYWSKFYAVFGICFLMGGIGHGFYNYFGVQGKYASWILGHVPVYFIEKAMISIFPHNQLSRKLKIVAALKFAFFVSISVLIYFTHDFNDNPSQGILIPLLNSFLGLGLSLGVLGYMYKNKIDESFKYIFYSSMILFPIMFIQLLKINIHPWFDKNDFAHLLLIAGMFMYFKSITQYNEKLTES